MFVVLTNLNADSRKTEALVLAPRCLGSVEKRYTSPERKLLRATFVVAVLVGWYRAVPLQRGTQKIVMRILVAVAPTMYRQTLALILRKQRPNHEVRLADPEALDREASSFLPHLIVCNDTASEVREVSVPSWVVIRFHDSLSASVFLDGQDTQLIQDIEIEDLLGVVDETQRLVLRGS